MEEDAKISGTRYPGLAQLGADIHGRALLVVRGPLRCVLHPLSRTGSNDDNRPIQSHWHSGLLEVSPQGHDLPGCVVVSLSLASWPLGFGEGGGFLVDGPNRVCAKRPAHLRQETQ